MVSPGSAGPPRSKTSHPPKGNEGFDRAHRGGLRAPSCSRPRPPSHPLPSRTELCRAFARLRIWAFYLLRTAPWTCRRPTIAIDPGLRGNVLVALPAKPAE